MSRIARCALVFAAVFFVGCGNGEPAAEKSEPRNTTEYAVKEMARITDKVCACPDLPCAEAALKELRAIPEPPSKPTKPQMERAMELATKMAGCQRRLMPDDPPPAP